MRELGIAYLWNFELENAAKVFSVYKSSDLRTALHDAETYLFRVLVTGRKSDIMKCMEIIDEI